VKQHVFLIGFMGSGKSTTAKRLSKRLGCEYIDTDLLIEELEHMSISQIFQNQGEAYFRQKEKDVLCQVIQSQPSVVATGGGIVLDRWNIDLMRDNGVVVYLEANSNVLYERVRGCTTRPLLKGEELFHRLLHSRLHLYEEAAHHTVHTSDLSEEDVEDGVLKVLSRKRCMCFETC
jgi:shikimate kinase